MSSAAALEALGHATSGALGTATSTALLYPLELTTTRLKTKNESSKGGESDGVIRTLKDIISEEGTQALYHGAGPAVAKSIIDSFLFFGFYHYLKPKHRKPRILEELGFGALAGAASRLVTTPISNVVTLAQASTGHESFRDLYNGIKDKSGILGLWSGYSATLILTLNPSITFLLNRRLAAWVIPALEQEDIPVAWVAFCLAACSKTAATAMTFPFQTAKTKLQMASSRPHGEAPRPVLQDESTGPPEKETISPSDNAIVRCLRRLFESLKESIFGVVLYIFQCEGVAGLFRGFPAEALKSFLSHGVTMLAKGLIYRIVVRLWMQRKHCDLRGRFLAKR